MMTLSNPMMIALSMWLCGHDYKDMNAPLKLSTLLQCLRDLGILRGNQKQIERALKRTSIPATFPVREVGKWALIVLFVCKPSATWQASADGWIEKNRTLLIEKGALLPDATRYQLEVDYDHSPSITH
jgi:hypothetical protein